MKSLNLLVKITQRAHARTEGGGKEKENQGCNHVFSTYVSMSAWLGDVPAMSTTCALPWSREIKAVVCSKLHLIIALEEVGRGSPIQPRYIQVTMTTAQSERTVWSRGCLHKRWWKQRDGGGFPPRKNVKVRGALFQRGKREDAMTLLLHSINNSCTQRAGLFSLGSYLEAAEGERTARWWKLNVINYLHLLVGAKYWLGNLKGNALNGMLEGRPQMKNLETLNSHFSTCCSADMTN